MTRPSIIQITIVSSYKLPQANELFSHHSIQSLPVYLANLCFWMDELDIIGYCMGACCDYIIQKEQIHTNQSRLRVLEHKVKALHRTSNDSHFTYFLPLFEQHALLQRIIQAYKCPTEPTDDTSHTSPDLLTQEYKQLQQYMQDYDDEGSELRKRMTQDQKRIFEELGETASEGCMVKMEIQSLEVVKGISRIKLLQEVGGEKALRKEEYIVVNRTRSQLIYREFIFPSPSHSKIRLTTDPVLSAMTIDVEDLAKAEVICQVFNFKAKDEDFGFLALRMQFVATSETYRKEKHQRLAILQKQLKLCQQGKDGVERLSQYRSDTSSLRNTFLSEPVSEYPNQYQA